MVATIRHELTEAVISYEEKPRDQWIFEPPAQVRLAYLCICTCTCTVLHKMYMHERTYM